MRKANILLIEDDELDTISVERSLKKLEIEGTYLSNRLQFFKDINSVRWRTKDPIHLLTKIVRKRKEAIEKEDNQSVASLIRSVFDEMDKVIRKELGKDKLITPDMVRGKYKTLEEAVLHDNWPTLKEAKGRFLFLLDNNGAKRDLYALNHPSLKGRAVFINAEPGKPEAATLFRNNSEDPQIEDLVKRKVKAIVCLGVDNHKIIDFFKDKKTQIYDTSSMQKAVEVSKSIAEKGDVVLLSPCCASFDLFANYEDRGQQFKQAVRML